MSNLKQNGQLRWAPSYLRNRGKVTRAQKRAMKEWWPEYGITFEHGRRIDLDTCFPGSGPLVIEIGFGMGDHLVSLAAARPDCRVLGVEVHRPGLAAATMKIHESGCSNVRLIRGDARLVLSDHLHGQIADAIFVQFPDPWPKPGSGHRRLIQPGMVEVMKNILQPGGEFLLTTDVEEYADHCRKVFAEGKGWKETGFSSWHQYRIRTPYEEKGLKNGHSISELAYRVLP